MLYSTALVLRKVCNEREKIITMRQNCAASAGASNASMKVLSASWHSYPFDLRRSRLTQLWYRATAVELAGAPYSGIGQPRLLTES